VEVFHLFWITQWSFSIYEIETVNGPKSNPRGFWGRFRGVSYSNDQRERSHNVRDLGARWDATSLRRELP
jgi:hypothetical protein